ncbi:MAG: rRNA maturation RNase YbeY [Candidatus Limnocylindrales bacterium]
MDLTVGAGVPKIASGAGLARAVARALAAGGAPSPASIGLTLTDDRALAALNVTHMGQDGPTDVLSFPLLAPEAFPGHEGADRRPTSGSAARPTPRAAARPAPRSTAFALPPGIRVHLGDIVVSVERAIDQARTGRGGWTGDVRWSPADELRLLVTHGTLHICGWDHADPAEQAAMRRLEEALLGA